MSFTVHPIANQDLSEYGDALSAHPTHALAKLRAEAIADRHFFGVCIVDGLTGEVDWGFGANINAPPNACECEGGDLSTCEHFDEVTERIDNVDQLMFEAYARSCE